MMLQILKKQNYNQLFLTNFKRSLVAILAMGLFAVNTQGKDFSHEKNKLLLLKPSTNLNNEEYDLFILGKSFFRIPWVEAPSATTARDGLGPIFNANTCVSCHANNGRGNLYNNEGEFARSLIPKLSLNSKIIDSKKGLEPEPTYGNQISINANHGIDFEAKTNITFEEIKIIFPDGEIDTLLKPKYALKNLNYGPLHKDTILTFRLAPSLNGIGLLEDISEEDILKNVDENDENRDGISGKANYVYSPISKKVQLGRFSWKASISNLKHQTADAANNDMGLTSKYYPYENCTNSQEKCNKAPKGRDEFDITELRLDAMTFYLKNRFTYTAKENKNYQDGLKVFKQIGCNSCHIESFTTISGVKIAPFSDLLLHDMGEDLADKRVEFNANGNEWRTAPLWGLALHEKINGKKPRLLHDGRARDFQEAILWHGGEALKAKDNYMNLKKEEREKLLKFLEEV